MEVGSTPVVTAPVVHAVGALARAQVSGEEVPLQNGPWRWGSRLL
jgi:hypothetical protein